MLYFRCNNNILVLKHISLLTVLYVRWYVNRVYKISHSQAENRKYRNERTRLIDERNENFTRLRKLYSQEDEVKKDIAITRDDMYKNRKCKPDNCSYSSIWPLSLYILYCIS